MVCLALSCQAFAERGSVSLQERTSNWAKSSSNGGYSGSGDEDLIDGETSGEAPNVPLSDSLLFLSLLAGAYWIVLHKREKKSVRNGCYNPAF
jgi:hypothetical protein